MIAHLAGTILRKSPDSVVVDVQGVGYKVFVTALTSESMPPKGSPVNLDIYTVVRENEIALFGFLQIAESRLFEVLLGVSGVGPRMALAILGHCSWQELVVAIEQENVARLRAIKGIGEKTAKLLILGLKSKLNDLRAMLPSEGSALGLKTMTLARNAEAALLSLGYSRGAIQKTLASLSMDAEVPLQKIIKESLQILSKQVSAGEMK